MPDYGGGRADSGEASTNTAKDATAATEAADRTAEGASAAESEAEATPPASE
jgi:hypothetical protein